MDFQEIVREICRGLEELSRTDPDQIAGCKTGEDSTIPGAGTASRMSWWSSPMAASTASR